MTGLILSLIWTKILILKVAVLNKVLLQQQDN